MWSHLHGHCNIVNPFTFHIFRLGGHVATISLCKKMHIAILIENPTKTTLNHSMSKRSLRENVNQRQLKPCKEGAYSVASLISVVTKKERKNKKNNKTK